MDQLDTFIKEIIDAKQLPGVTEEAKEGLLEEMRERLVDMINRALIDALPDDKLAELTSLLEDPAQSGAQAQQFIAESGIDVERITAKTMLTFRGLYLQAGSQSAQPAES